MKKKIIAAVMALSMLLGGSVYADTAHSDWAESYIAEAGGLGIIPSSILNTDMTEDITREQFCELAYSTIGVISKQNSIKITYTVRESKFSDTDNVAVTALKRMGIISGRTSTRFDPDASITREEAASILMRIADCLGLTKFASSELFTDRKEISSWAKESVNAVCGMNIMSGMGDGSFDPDGSYTKEQAVSTMIRLMNNVPDSGSREKIDNKRYYMSNSYYRWVENENGKVVFKVSAEKYGKVSFYSDGEKLLAFAEDGANTDVYDIDSGKKLFTMEGTLAGIDSNKYILTADSEGALLNVYDFRGNKQQSGEYSWD